MSDPVVTLEIDLDAGTYTVGFNGKTYPNLPLENRGPIDTIRFVASGCSKTGFLKSSIDDLIVVGGRKPAVAQGHWRIRPPDFRPRRCGKETDGSEDADLRELAGVDIKDLQGAGGTVDGEALRGLSRSG